MRDSDVQRSAPGTRPSPQRLGLFGGSFNPIHVCHLTIARQARDLLQLDQILFIPTGDPPHKPDGTLAPAKDRYEMVRLAIADVPYFALSDIELRRSGKSYSIDTVRALRRQYGSETALFFLIGLDAFLDLPTWREPLALLRACRFVVISRPGVSFQTLSALPLVPTIAPEVLADLDAGHRTILEVPGEDGTSVIYLRLPPCDASASEIRRRIREHVPPGNTLPGPVQSYIIQHHLYREDADHTRV